MTRNQKNKLAELPPGTVLAAQHVLPNGDQQEHVEIKRRSIKGVISYVVRTFANTGVNAVALFILGALLETNEFGVFYVVMSVLGFFTFLSDIGLASALVQKKTEPTVEDLRTTFTVQQILSILIFLIVYALTPYWVNVQGLVGMQLWLLYVVTASMFVVTFKTIPSILLTRKLRFDLLAIPIVTENIAFYAVTIFFAWQGKGIESFIWGVLARDFIGITVMYSLQRWPIGIGIWMKSLKELLNFGVKFQANDLLARVKDDLFNIVIVSAWLDKDALGYIGWAKRYTNQAQQFTINNITAITFPTYARMQHDPELLKKGIEKTLYFLTLVAFPLLAGMTMFFLPLMEVFPQFEKWRPAVLLIALFAFNIAWSTLSTPLTNTLNAIGHVNKTLKLMIMWTVLTWTITPVCIRYFGYNGVGIASALIGLSSLVTVYMVQQVVPFRLIPMIWRQVFASICMILFGVLTLPLWGNSLLHLIAGVLITGSVYVGAFLLVGWKSLQKELESLGLWPLPLRFFRS